ncbi:transmembrane protein 68-like [Podarcis raffonei]|uniref:transmembrane protein 68-like n=1 Tax=Podarcis raffonei TaxID=65483 RepID=UPI00232949DE|nr:transmembrane protein 68-like [Podarcis raffonei]
MLAAGEEDLWMGSAAHQQHRQQQQVPTNKSAWIPAETFSEPQCFLPIKDCNISFIFQQNNIYLLHFILFPGYEVFGMEHLPKGPVLIIFYHPVSTIDYFFLIARLFKETGRECFSICDHSIYRFPGWKTALNAAGVKDFNKAECVEILKKGHSLGIPPGGAREGNFSTDYNIMWGNRTGFARIALEAKVPIIPIFTQNICEAYRNIGKSRLTRWFYEKTRFFYLPVYGPFPVKLRTYIGEPIPYDPNITAAELAEKTKTAIENLRDKHQKRPGNILRAISERFDKHYKAD